MKAHSVELGHKSYGLSNFRYFEYIFWPKWLNVIEILSFIMQVGEWDISVSSDPIYPRLLYIYLIIDRWDRGQKWIYRHSISVCPPSPYKQISTYEKTARAVRKKKRTDNFKIKNAPQEEFSNNLFTQCSILLWFGWIFINVVWVGRLPNHGRGNSHTTIHHKYGRISD